MAQGYAERLVPSLDDSDAWNNMMNTEAYGNFFFLIHHNVKYVINVLFVSLLVLFLGQLYFC